MKLYPFPFMYLQAGIDTYKLCLALEPEAASLTCRYLRINVERGLAEKSADIMPFTAGAKYLVLDAGGNCDYFKRFIPEFLKWTLPSLSLVGTIGPNRGLSKKSN